MYSWLPPFAKAGWIRYNQRSLNIETWDHFSHAIGRTYDSVAIVGNAGYLTDLELGHAIDDHALVVRLNNFRTRGYERQVGKRCDVLVTNFFTDICYDRPELADVLYLVASVPNTFRKAKRSYIFRRHGEHIAEGMRRLGRHDAYVPSHETFLAACDMCRGVPSTGYMAVQFALTQLLWRRLFVTGFSFFRGREHYFQGQAAPRPRHNFDRERHVLANLLVPLVERGVVRLDAPMTADLVEARGEDRSHSTGSIRRTEA